MKQKNRLTEKQQEILVNNIKSKMAEFNMKQSFMAKQLGITEGAMSNYMRMIRVPNVDILYGIANVLGTTIDELISGNGK